MIGLIVTGHGNFATGLESSLRVIAGNIEGIRFIDFEINDSVEYLETRLSRAIEEFGDEILVLSDLQGGSPYKTAVTLASTSDKKIEVVAGVNLPMLIEVAMAKGFMDSIDQLTENALVSGRDNINKFVFVAHEEESEEDGI